MIDEPPWIGGQPLPHVPVRRDEAVTLELLRDRDYVVCI